MSYNHIGLIDLAASNDQRMNDFDAVFNPRYARALVQANHYSGNKIAPAPDCVGSFCRSSGQNTQATNENSKCGVDLCSYKSSSNSFNYGK